MASTILPESARIGFVTILRQFEHWFFLLLESLQGCCRLIRHLDVLIGYQFLHVDRHKELLQVYPDEHSRYSDRRGMYQSR